MGCLKSRSSQRRCNMSDNLPVILRDRVSIIISAVLLIVVGPAGLACITGLYLKLMWMCFQWGWNYLG